MNFWFNEKETDNIQVQWTVEKAIYSTNSKFQRIDVVDLKEFGRTLILDGVLQTTYGDEFMYHEMLAHVPLAGLSKPKRVLVVGGGDGGTLREVLKHPVENVDLVEIDGEVIRASQEYLPRLGGAFADSRANVIVADAIKYVKNTEHQYDCVLVDSSDPVGPAVGLFSGDFYRDIFRILSPQGVMAAQTESPLFNQSLIQNVNKDLRSIFPQVSFYWCSVPSYSIGPWSFALAAKCDSPQSHLRTLTGCRYYNQDIHRASFALPSYFIDLLGE